MAPSRSARTILISSDDKQIHCFDSLDFSLPIYVQIFFRSAIRSRYEWTKRQIEKGMDGHSSALIAATPVGATITIRFSEDFFKFSESSFTCTAFL
ncbi:MAG: hypothetical protein IPO25_19860 [Saprospiraceae bacterium]|nr:hypothetical protein [Saprospiraceae bacterium]